MSSYTAKILDIVRGTTVDGPGFRTSIYFAGCLHECPGCHNPHTWNFDAGEDYTLEQIMDIIREEDFDVTLSGGDPLYQLEFVDRLIDEIHNFDHNVWIYTGFTWEEILTLPNMLRVVSKADVLVDSPFIFALKDPDLLFRGSSNQRIINIPKSLTVGKIEFWERNL